MAGILRRAGGEYEKFLRIYLPQLKQKLEELGVLEEAYFHISDEPNLNQIDSYRAASEIVQKELAGCKFLEALSDYEFYQTGLVSRPVCGSNHIQPFLEKQTPGALGILLYRTGCRCEQPLHGDVTWTYPDDRRTAV